MVWLRSLAIALALGSATWAYAQATGTQPAVKDKSDNLELRLEPKDIQKGMPQGFTFALVNISDHDVLIPATPVVNCHSQYSGSIWLVHTFTPLTPGPLGSGGGCAASKYNWPPLMDRVNSPWCKSGFVFRIVLEYPQGSFVSCVHGDGEAAASRAARGFVGGAYGVGHRTGTSIL